MKCFGSKKPDRPAVSAGETSTTTTTKPEKRSSKDGRSLRPDKPERTTKLDHSTKGGTASTTSSSSRMPSPCLAARLADNPPAGKVYRPSQPNKTRSRFSLRRLFYAYPLLSPPFTAAAAVSSPGRRRRRREKEAEQTSWGMMSQERDTCSLASSVLPGPSSASSSSPPLYTDGAASMLESGMRECPVCLAEYSLDQFPSLRNCRHVACLICLQQYVRIEVQEGRANLKCPQCSEQLHPNDVEFLVGGDTSLLQLYQFLMVRRVLAADPDTRWCPAPNCTYAVVATGCASCPKISCEREGCDSAFCYHCKAEWHPNQTCDMARAQRRPLRSSRVSFSQESGLGGGSELKICPRCSVLIVKMDDGSCNHMTCAVCGSEFCWLCMKEISDLHYLSPSGCTFWGKKPWSRKKKLLWQLGTMVGAPVGIALIAGISVPAVLIGLPVWVGRKIHARHATSGRHKRILAITGGVTASLIISPLLAGLAVSIGVPILLAYVYGVVPISLCRSGGCGVRTTGAGVRLDIEEETTTAYGKAMAGGSGGHATADLGGGGMSSRVANPSIGEVSLGASLSLGSGSHLDRLTECDRESASNTAVAGYSLTGSVASSYLGQHRLEVGADVHPRKKYSFSSERLSETVSLSEKSASLSLADNDGAASTRALAGSLLQYRLENSSLASSSRLGGQATPGSCASAETGGDEISLRSLPGGGNGQQQQQQRSLSPVCLLSGEEVSAALRRSSRRRVLEKQNSENSSLLSGEAIALDQDVSERVRFDSHVSFIDATKLELEADRTRLAIKKAELESETLREETAEELALVISPQTRRAPSPLFVHHDLGPPLPSLLLHLDPDRPVPILGRPDAPVLVPVEESSSSSLSPGGDQGPLLMSVTPTDELPLLPADKNSGGRLQEDRNVSLVSVESSSNVTSISIEHDSRSYLACTSDITLVCEGTDNIGYLTSMDSPTTLSIPIGSPTSSSSDVEKTTATE